MNGLSREQLVKLVDVMSQMLLEYADAQTVEAELRSYGIGDHELSEIGFDVNYPNEEEVFSNDL